MMFKTKIYLVFNETDYQNTLECEIAEIVIDTKNRMRNIFDNL